MTRLLIRLYPAAWRKRYGDELEELIGDTRSGWRAVLDVFKGAMTMRLRSSSIIRLALGLIAAMGGLAGMAISYFIPEVWEATVVAEIYGPGGAQQLMESLEKSRSNVTSRHSLFKMMTDSRLDIYRLERQTKPIEDIEDKMRQNTHVGIISVVQKDGGVVFSVSFLYSDPSKAVDTTNTLLARIREELAPGYSIQVLDSPVVPRKPVAPKRLAFIVLGLLAGLTIAFIAFIVRRRPNPPGPGLQAA